MANSNADRLGALDLLRGIAISGVVISHSAIFFQPSTAYMAVFQYGAQGVQLFFIVSAVTMCYMWDQRKGEPLQALKFYIRRFFRIAPIFWFAMIFYCVVKALKGDPQPGLWQVATSFFLVHGFSPFTNNAIVPGGWSIAVEIFFYLIFPLAIRFSKDNRMCLVWAVLLFAVVDVAMAEYLKNAVFSDAGVYGGVDWHEYLYQSVLTQLPVFFFGMLAYRLTLLHDLRGLWFCAAGFAAWLAVAFVLKEHGYFGRPFFWLICAFFFALAVWALRTQATNAVLVFLGKMSYSLYIFHFAVIDLFHHFVPAGLRGNVLAFAGWTAAIFICSVVVAECSRRTLEAWSSDLSRWMVSRVSRRSGKNLIVN